MCVCIYIYIYIYIYIHNMTCAAYTHTTCHRERDPTPQNSDLYNQCILATE